MSDDNAHAGNVADLLRTAEEDNNVPEDLKTRAKERREELEADQKTATIYLAGPVAADDDGGAAWRNEVQDHYADEFDFRDPLGKYNVKLDDLELVDGHSDPDHPETVGIDELVERDKELIRESDGLLVAYSAVRSIGTPMEVMFARERNMPVAIWLRDGTEREDLSPWYRYHATAITNDVEAALRHVDRQRIGRKPVTDGGIVREYDSPHEKLRQEFEILLGQNNTVLREMPAYTVGQLFQLVDAVRRKYDVGIEEVREEEDGVRLLMLTGREVSDEIAAAVGIDHPDQVGDLDVHMIDDRKMGGGG